MTAKGGMVPQEGFEPPATRLRSGSILVALAHMAVRCISKKPAMLAFYSIIG